jgi:RNA polymerase-binding transcription factor DksA
VNEANEQPDSTVPEPEPTEPGPTGDAASDTLDLDEIERDLAGVEAALRRLDDGTYWTDEVTGEPIPDEVLAADPVARRAG